jgi:CBS domain-containing protein
MTVSAICNHNVVTIEPDADVAEAAARMREEHVGDLIVTEQRGGLTVPIGIVTDRDLVISVIAKQVPLDALKVGDVMTSELLTVREDNGIEFALREMRRAGVRRAPVLGTAGELIGVLSIDDVVDHLASQLSHIADIIRLGQQAEASIRP